MSMGKKEIDATRKKGMVLNDDALANVTGGYYVLQNICYADGRSQEMLRNVGFNTPEAAKAYAEKHEMRSWDVAHRRSYGICFVDKWTSPYVTHPV